MIDAEQTFRYRGPYKIFFFDFQDINQYTRINYQLHSGYYKLHGRSGDCKNWKIIESSNAIGACV